MHNISVVKEEGTRLGTPPRDPKFVWGILTGRYKIKTLGSFRSEIVPRALPTSSRAEAKYRLPGIWDPLVS